MQRQEGINKRTQQLNEFFDVFAPSITSPTIYRANLGRGNSWVQKFVNEAFTLPIKFTVGAIDFLELSAEKATAAVEGLVRNRKDTLKELGRTAKETPMEVARAFDIRDPATAAQLTALLVGGVRAVKAGKAGATGGKAKAPKPPKGQLTLKQTVKNIAKTNKTKTAILNKIVKKVKAAKKKVVAKSNKTNLDIARRENNLGRSLTMKEKRAVKKSLASINKAEMETLLKDIVRRENNLGRSLRSKEIETILKVKYETKLVTKGVGKRAKPRYKKATNIRKGQSMFKNKKAQGQLKLESVLELGKKATRGAVETGRRIGRASGKVKVRPRLLKTPIIGLAGAQALDLTQRPISITDTARQSDTTYKQAQRIGQGQKQGQKQKQGQLQIPKSLVYAIAGTTMVATSLQRIRRGKTPPKPPMKGKQSKTWSDYDFSNYVYSAKRNKKGIYLPDLYAVLNNEKATGKQKVKYLNPNTVFTGFEARPIIG